MAAARLVRRVVAQRAGEVRVLDDPQVPDPRMHRVVPVHRDRHLERPVAHQGPQRRVHHPAPRRKPLEETEQCVRVVEEVVGLRRCPDADVDQPAARVQLVLGIPVSQQADVVPYRGDEVDLERNAIDRPLTIQRLVEIVARAEPDGAQLDVLDQAARGVLEYRVHHQVHRPVAAGGDELGLAVANRPGHDQVDGGGVRRDDQLESPKTIADARLQPVPLRPRGSGAGVRIQNDDHLYLRFRDRCLRSVLSSVSAPSPPYTRRSRGGAPASRPASARRRSPPVAG